MSLITYILLLLVTIVCIAIFQVEWPRSTIEEGADHVIVYAVTDDHAADTYQSSKAVQSNLFSSAEVKKHNTRYSLTADAV